MTFKQNQLFIHLATAGVSGNSAHEIIYAEMDFKLKSKVRCTGVDFDWFCLFVTEQTKDVNHFEWSTIIVKLPIRDAIKWFSIIFFSSSLSFMGDVSHPIFG